MNVNVTQANAADLAAERARVFKIPAVEISGHCGAQRGYVGVYAVNPAFSPTNDGNVYSLEKSVGAASLGTHLYRASNGAWCVSDTEVCFVA